MTERARLASSPALHASSLPPGSEPSSILLVDHDEVRVPLTEAELAKDAHGVHVLTEPDNLAAVVAEVEPDVIVIADQFADITGFELCGDLRMTEEGKHVAIVILSTALARENEVARALRAGADDCVSMDRRVELRARIQARLRDKRYRDSLRRIRSERDRLRVAASIDTLTGLPNRSVLEDAIRQKMADNASFAVLFLDIDFFKKVNDTFGHDIGDRVLRAVATYMKRSIRADDLCGRYGGEEFVIIVQGADLALAQRIAERHRVGIAAVPLPDIGERGHVTVSIGVADFAPASADTDAESLLKRADQALYEAKRRGRNRVVAATPQGGVLRVPAISMDLMPASTPASGRDEAVPQSLTTPLEGELVRQLGSGRSALPVLPTVAMDAIRLADNPRADLASFAKLVSQDPHFAARFLSTANSSVYSRGVKANTVRDAIVRIGLASARDLLFQVVFANAYGNLPHFQAEVARSFQRSITAGIAARTYCQKAQVDFPLDYLCGLLHDVGEGRVYRILAGIRDASKSPSQVTDLVLRYHARAGADIAAAWRLPKEIIDACAHHHDAGTETNTSVRIAKISDVLVAEVERAEADEPSEATVRQLSALGAPPEMTAALCAEVRRALAQAKAAGEEVASGRGGPRSVH
jgi:diguanylate cyclase (GGDEF)-like protein